MKLRLSPVRRNAAASYVNFVVVAIVGVIVNPLLAGALGASAFGVWKSCQKAIDFATVADGRATQALKWIIAYRSGETDPGVLRRSVGASLAVWVLLVPIVAIIATLIAFALPLMLSGIPDDQTNSVRVVAAVLGLNVLLAGLLSVPDSILVGTNQGYRSMSVTTFALICVNIAMVVAVQHGYGIKTLAMLTVAGAVINALITFVVARRRVPWMGAHRPSSADVKTVARFSGWVMGWSFVTKIYLATELLLFGSLIGVSAAAHFTFTNYVLSFALSACLMTGSAFMPQLGLALGAKNHEAAQQSIRDAREVSLALAVLCAGVVLALNGSFVDAWIGSRFYLGDTTNALMTLAFLQLAVLRTEAQIQDTGLDIKLKVLTGLAGAFLSAGLAVVMYTWLESVSAMYIGLILGRLVPSFVFPRLVARLAPGSGGTWRHLLMSAAILLPCGAIGALLGSTGPLLLVPISLAVAAVIGIACYLGLLSAPVRAKMRRTVRA
ncbi:hypothetical protein ASD11_14080 [Aeromicrobium sp. Root495]|uniref:oligosaccharide flippase family protein n=1 Tax=Aeromicrobium sp. Root495 TaxID=1736550 RepID=UPI0006F5D58A|nr:oligosaccharide flippase family protein [Aeromicrobium sp. Root495]KQY60561.1 hypothetical protein ASD11_14080 [Aeromicrobium sp. Root495]